eukprot:COSAG02_NODE_14485_length_1267_cov_0.985445_2_plen_118_part_00
MKASVTMYKVTTVSQARAAVVACSECGYLVPVLARSQWNVTAGLAGGQWHKRYAFSGASCCRQKRWQSCVRAVRSSFLHQHALLFRLHNEWAWFDDVGSRYFEVADELMTVYPAYDA